MKEQRVTIKGKGGSVEKFPPTPDESQTPPPAPAGVDKKPRGGKNRGSEKLKLDRRALVGKPRAPATQPKTEV